MYVTWSLPLVAVLMVYKYRSDFPTNEMIKDHQERCFMTNGAKPPADEQRDLNT